MTKSRYVLGHGRLCASGVLTGHSEGMWAIFMIKVKLMASIPKCWNCWTVLQNASLPMEGSLPRVVCDPGSVMKLQASAKSFSVFILLEWSFPCSALSSWIWVGENVPPENSCSSSQGQASCWPGRRERVACRAEPWRAAVFSLAPLNLRFTVHSCIPAMRVGVSEVATPNPAEIMSPGVKLPRVLPRVSCPFLSSESRKLKWLIWTNTSSKVFQFSLSVLIGTVYCRLRGQHDSHRGETTASAHDDEDELHDILSLPFLYKKLYGRNLLFYLYRVQDKGVTLRGWSYSRKFQCD